MNRCPGPRPKSFQNSPPLAPATPYIDGGITIQRFLRAGLIQRLIITRVPVLIGDGIPLFGSLLHDIRLRHISTKHYPIGLLSSEYHVAD